MSLVTSCPACSTMFRVVPDQLKVSDGWVRCGQCGEVFDASLHVVSGSSVPGPASAPAVNAPASAASPAPSLAASSTRAGDEPQFPADPGSPMAAAQATATQPEPESEPAPLADELPAGREAASNEDLLREPAESAANDSVVYASTTQEPVALRFGTDDASDSTLGPASLGDVSFVRAARRKAFWARPAVRASLVLLSLVLLLVLVGQFVVHERDRIAAIDPRTAPWLERACDTLGCELRPLRRIESIAIDSSTFTKLKADAYRVQLVLKNASPLDLAAPAIELTLTDTQDQPVVRRVLTLDELGIDDEVLAAGAELRVNAAIALSGAGLARVAGYRVLAFYP